MIDAWTGERPTQLQDAMRLSNEDYAEHLGISSRAVAEWHASPAMRPHPESQPLLDAVLDRASRGDRQRFELMNGGRAPADTTSAPQTLYAAISIVQKDDVIQPSDAVTANRSGGRAVRLPRSCKSTLRPNLADTDMLSATRSKRRIL